jgi:predicted ATPase
VDEGVLRVNVAALRKALGDGRGGNRFIANIPGHGYSFVAPVRREQGQEIPALPYRPAPDLNFPAQLTRVIARTEIIATVVARVAQQRFLTIVGPGGIGKTTVAVAAAKALSGSYAGGVWFISLGPLQDPALVPGAVSAVLGSPPGVGDPLSSLVAWLRDKCALIVIDNCEHVVGAAAATAEAMLRAAPQVAVLATSREPLRAEGEWLLRLPSQEVPPERSGLTAAEALSFPAVELFYERAVATLNGFDLADADIPITLEICRRLDGVPLAIELAAAQVDVFGVSGLAAHLDDRLAVLTRGCRTAVPRQQTLRATIDWSYELLSEPERHLLCRLAIFPVGFGLEAAAAVVSGSHDGAAVIREGIASLVAKSLLTRDGSTPAGRWRLLERN